MADDIRNNPADSRFEWEIDGHLAVVSYRLQPGKVTFTHTGVPDALSGRGLASRMARHVLDWARAEGLKVEPQCAFVAAYMKKHPEYEDIRA